MRGQQGPQARKVVQAERGVGTEEQGRLADETHRHHLARVERHAVDGVGVDGHRADAAEEERVAVVLGGHHGLGAEIAGFTGAVVDLDGDTQRDLQRGKQQTAGQVGPAALGEAHHDRDGTSRIPGILREGRRGAGATGEREKGATWKRAHGDHSSQVNLS